MWAKQFAFATVIVAGTAATACAQFVTPRIINGQPTEQFPSVGIVGSVVLGDFCTGTLISPFHVLTAGHCAEAIGSDTDGLFTLGGQSYRTARVIPHPDFNPRTLANDIAVLELAEPVLAAPVLPIFEDVPRVGETIIIVGFGEQGDANGSSGGFGTKRSGTTTIDAVTETLVIWDFDDPQESNTAPGDSGGPGLLDRGGQLFVATVTSGGTVPDAGLGDMAFNTRVDAFASWIQSVLDGPISPAPPVDPPVVDPPVIDPPVVDPSPPVVPGDGAGGLPLPPHDCPSSMGGGGHRGPGHRPMHGRPPHREPSPPRPAQHPVLQLIGLFFPAFQSPMFQSQIFWGLPAHSDRSAPIRLPAVAHRRPDDTPVRPSLGFGTAPVTLVGPTASLIDQSADRPRTVPGGQSATRRPTLQWGGPRRSRGG